MCVGESTTSSRSTVVTADDTALGPPPRKRDNPAGAAAAISSFCRDNVSRKPDEPDACDDILLPSTPSVKGVTKAINLVADEALTPPCLATRSITEEVSPPKIFP